MRLRVAQTEVESFSCRYLPSVPLVSKAVQMVTERPSWLFTGRSVSSGVSSAPAGLTAAPVPPHLPFLCQRPFSMALRRAAVRCVTEMNAGSFIEEMRSIPCLLGLAGQPKLRLFTLRERPKFLDLMRDFHRAPCVFSCLMSEGEFRIISLRNQYLHWRGSETGRVAQNYVRTRSKPAALSFPPVTLRQQSAAASAAGETLLTCSYPARHGWEIDFSQISWRK